MNKSITLIELVTRGNDVRVSTLEIAKHTGLNHQSIIKLVRKYEDKFIQLDTLRFEILKSGGRPTEYVLLTEPHTMFLYTLFRNLTDDIVDFKLNLTKTFYQLKKIIQDRHNAEWIKHRDSGKIVTKHLTSLFNDALLLCGKTPESHHFINLQQAIYKATLGKTCQALRKERNIPRHCIIRDYLNPKELERVSILQGIAEIILHKHEHVTNDMVISAISQAGNMLQLASNCLVVDNHREVA